MQAPPLTQPAVQGLLVPLLATTILDGVGGAAGGHGDKRGAADRAQGVADVAVTTVNVLARKLPWPAYLNLLSRFLKVLPRNKNT